MFRSIGTTSAKRCFFIAFLLGALTAIYVGGMGMSVLFGGTSMVSALPSCFYGVLAFLGCRFFISCGRRIEERRTAYFRFLVSPR